MNPFGHIWQFVNGLIVDIEVDGASKVYVTPSMYAAYDSTTVADKIFAGNMARSGGWIKELIYDKLAMLPSKVGGSGSTYHGDELYTNPATYHGLKVRLAGGNANNGANAGASNSNTNNSATNTNANISAPLYLTVIEGEGLGTGQKITTKKVLVGFELKLDGSEDI